MGTKYSEVQRELYLHKLLASNSTAGVTRGWGAAEMKAAKAIKEKTEEIFILSGDLKDWNLDLDETEERQKAGKD